MLTGWEGGEKGRGKAVGMHHISEISYLKLSTSAFHSLREKGSCLPSWGVTKRACLFIPVTWLA